MKYCVHCGLPARSDCVNHVQDVPRRHKRTIKAQKATVDFSIHGRKVEVARGK